MNPIGRIRPGALTSAALAPLLLLLPAPLPWSWPLVVAGAVWAPGYTTLAVLYPLGSLKSLERHALAAGVGLLVLPVIAMATSVAAGFHRASLTLALLLVACTGAVLASLRTRNAKAERPSFVPLPSTRATLVLCGLALAVAAILLAWPQAGSTEPPALSLEGQDGFALRLPPTASPNATIAFNVVLTAGDRPLRGDLVLTWDAHASTIPISLQPGATRSEPTAMPRLGAGLHSFVARFTGEDMAREVHFAVDIQGG